MTNVVVGAGSGMGTAVAHALAPRGHLIVADLNLESVEAVAKEIGGDVEAMACDITNAQQIEALMARIAELGDLDAFVISAGLSGSMAPGRRILEVNLIGTARTLAAVEPHLRPGSVGICFASMSGTGSRRTGSSRPCWTTPCPIISSTGSPRWGSTSRYGAPIPCRSTPCTGWSGAWRRCGARAGPDHVGIARYQRHADEPPRRREPPDHEGVHCGGTARPPRPPRRGGERRRLPDLRRRLLHDGQRRARRRRNGRRHPRGLDGGNVRATA